MRIYSTPHSMLRPTAPGGNWNDSPAHCSSAHCSVPLAKSGCVGHVRSCGAFPTLGPTEGQRDHRGPSPNDHGPEGAGNRYLAGPYFCPGRRGAWRWSLVPSKLGASHSCNRSDLAILQSGCWSDGACNNSSRDGPFSSAFALLCNKRAGESCNARLPSGSRYPKRLPASVMKR